MMREVRVGIGISAVLAAAAAFAIPLIAADASKTSPSRTAGGRRSTDGETAAQAAPAYVAALAGAQTAREHDVELRTPASGTRLVMSDGPDDIFVGRMDHRGALCISVQNRATDRLTTTCGSRSAVGAGELQLIRGGAAGQLIIGVAPRGSASVTVKTHGAPMTVPVDGGVFHARPDSPPVSLEFKDPAGRQIVSSATPGSAG